MKFLKIVTRFNFFLKNTAVRLSDLITAPGRLIAAAHCYMNF
jgi:hypothetical protein